MHPTSIATYHYPLTILGLLDNATYLECPRVCMSLRTERKNKTGFLAKRLIQFYVICRPKRNALFLVDLQLDIQGVHYSTNLNNFETMSVGLFDKGIQSTQSIPQLEKVILLNYAIKLKL